MPFDGENESFGGGNNEPYKLFLSFEPFNLIPFGNNLETFLNHVILSHYQDAKKVLTQDEIFPVIFNRGEFNSPTSRVFMSSPQARIQRLRNINDPLHWQFSQIAIYCPKEGSQLEQETIIAQQRFMQNISLTLVDCEFIQELGLPLEIGEKERREEYSKKFTDTNLNFKPFQISPYFKRPPKS